MAQHHNNACIAESLKEEYESQKQHATGPEPMHVMGRFLMLLHDHNARDLFHEFMHREGSSHGVGIRTLEGLGHAIGLQVFEIITSIARTIAREQQIDARPHAARLEMAFVEGLLEALDGIKDVVDLEGAVVDDDGSAYHCTIEGVLREIRGPRKPRG